MEISSLKNDSNSDLYTIPSYSSWFSWSSIHEIERISLPEFLDGSSITRSPRIYKEYRDFIISKFREDPTRTRLTFTEVRKSLVGDVNLLHKVFSFLEKWGLINFTAGDDANSDEKESNWEVRVEEGAPHGIRVVSAPNSLKPVTPPPPPVEVGGGGGGAEVAEIGTKFPPLGSYTNLFEELMVQKQGKKCGSCKESCDSNHYELIKDEEYTLCKKCFDNSSYGEDKKIDDFKFVDHKNQEVVWTQAETLLLLESVLKHGDDWDLVTENVKTKTKLDCIHKLLQLPFGDFLLGSSFSKNRVSDTNGGVSSVEEVRTTSSETQEIVNIVDEDEIQDKKTEVSGHDDKNQDKKTEVAGQDDKNQDEKIEKSGTDNKNQDVEMEDAGHDVKNPNENPDGDKNLDEKTENADQDKKTENPNQDDKTENSDQDEKTENVNQDDEKAENADQNEEMENADQDEEMENAEEQEGPPHKRRCTMPLYDASSSLMNQVARLASVVGPHITTAAAEAAIAELCHENGCTREFFDDDNFDAEDTGASSSSPLMNEQKTINESENGDGLQSSMVPEHEDKKVERNVVSLTLRMRAATATALGAAAAHAKQLADQEEREIEHLFATVLETQLKKLETKAKFLESMEQILEKQHNQIEEFKGFMISERINVLQEIFSCGLSRPSSLQPQSSNVV